MDIRKVTLIIICTLLEIPQLSAQRYFKEIETGLNGVNYSAFEWVDFDLDGDLDFSYLGLEEFPTKVITRIVENRGSEFVEAEFSLIQINDGDLKWADYDNDGDPDLLLMGDKEASFADRDVLQPITQLYENIEGKELLEKDTGFPNLSQGAIAWGDYDNDGYLDLVIFGKESDDSALTILYHNEADGSFSEVDHNFPDLYNGELDWGDYDGDGFLDLLITGATASDAGVTKLFRNNGDGTFNDSGVLFEQLIQGRTQFGDMDEDGDLDILLSGGEFSGLYKNEQSDYELVIFNDFESPHGASRWGDYDGDGKLDILGTCNIYQNVGQGLFSGILNYAFDGCVDRWGDLEWADYDADGDLDVIMIGEIDDVNDIRLFENEGGFEWIIRLQEGGLDGNAIEVLDFDKDGDFDILATGSDGGSMRTILYRGNDSQLLDPIRLDMPGLVYGDLSAVDYDGDCDYDILITGQDAGERPLTLLFKNNIGHQAQVNVDLAPVFLSSVDWADIDNDGDLDLAYTGADSADSNGYPISAGFYIYRNLGDDTFEEVGHNISPTIGGSIKFGDYNGDGLVDILTGGALEADSFGRLSKGVLNVYRNMGNGIFDEANIQLDGDDALIGSTKSRNFWADIDNDGDLDILTLGGSDARAYENQGENRFRRRDLGFEAPGHSVAIGDVNNDGLIDFIWSGAVNGFRRVKAYLNQGEFEFITDVNLNNFLHATSSGEIALADWDFDGDLDFVQVGEGTFSVIRNLIDHNNVGRQNNPPGAPFNLESLVTDNSVRLSWAEVEDDRTGTNGIYYNLYVKKKDDDYILCPNADPATGRYHFSTTKNAVLDNSLLVENLGKGLYEWGVQSIDPSFSSSNFEIATFEVENELITAPIITSVNRPAAEINIYPMPFVDYLHIDSFSNKFTQIGLYNMVGHELYKVSLNNGNLKLNLAPLKKGFYFMKLEGPNDQLIRKIVKQ